MQLCKMNEKLPAVSLLDAKDPRPGRKQSIIMLCYDVNLCTEMGRNGAGRVFVFN